MDKPSKPRRPKPKTTSNRARGSGRTLTSHTIGALPLIDKILGRMRFTDILEAYLPPKDSRAKLSISQGLTVLMKNILLSREPVYGLGEWARHYAPELLGLSTMQVDALNDDRVGRCLDRLFDSDKWSLVLAMVAHAIREFDVGLDELHNDSTTVTLFGRYDNAEEGARMRGKFTLVAARGHNKDHRPDLKQLLVILTLSADGGVPVHFRAANGNVTDDQTHRETWSLLSELRGGPDFLYVADSKLATRENMAHIHRNGGRFITVMPRTRKEDKQFRELMRQDKVGWKDILSKLDDEGHLVDAYQSTDRPMLTEEGYRLIWIHSSRKQEMDSEARAQTISRTLHQLAELRGRLRSPRTRYRERVKVEKAVAKILEERGAINWIELEVVEETEELFRQEKRGRPGKDTKYIQSVRKRFDLKYEVNTARVAEEAATDGIFPLVTNDEELVEREVLLAYKRQPVIEKRFAQLKSDYDVAPVYLKNIGRIEGLLHVYFLAMLVQALLEREVRREMEDQGLDVLPLYPESRDCRRPTSRRIFDVFENVQRHELREAGATSAMVTELSPVQKQLLKLLQVSRASYAGS